MNTIILNVLPFTFVVHTCITRPTVIRTNFVSPNAQFYMYMIAFPILVLTIKLKLYTDIIQNGIYQGIKGLALYKIVLEKQPV